MQDEIRLWWWYSFKKKWLRLWFLLSWWLVFIFYFILSAINMYTFFSVRFVNVKRFLRWLLQSLMSNVMVGYHLKEKLCYPPTSIVKFHFLQVSILRLCKTCNSIWIPPPNWIFQVPRVHLVWNLIFVKNACQTWFFNILEDFSIGYNCQMWMEKGKKFLTLVLLCVRWGGVGGWRI